VLQIGRSLVRSQLVPSEFFIDIKSFRSHYGPGVNSASNRNEYQEHFLGVKAAGYGLVINQNETKYTRHSRVQTNVKNKEIEIEGMKIEEVNSAKYLETI